MRISGCGTVTAAIAAALIITGCGGHSAAVRPAVATTAAATITAPAGCAQAALVTAAIRSDLHADPSGTKAALRQLQNLENSLPPGQLQADVSLAALDLAKFRVEMLYGFNAARTARHFAASLDKIGADCGR